MIVRNLRVLVLFSTCLVISAFTFSLQHARCQRIVFSRSLTVFNSYSAVAAEEWELPEESNDDVAREYEAPVSTKFVTGDELQWQRQKVLKMRKALREARRNLNIKRVTELERAIIAAQQKDAEFVYTMYLDRMNKAVENGDEDIVEEIREQAMEARRALPQFNLEGLWVGKYGDHGYEMINITYVGDTLIAHKVTGDKNVPKGEVTFKVDLSPEMDPENLLEPIELSYQASKQWGLKYLARFHGEGQIAEAGFRKPQFVDGQLILVNKYFSFAFTPLNIQIFFGRPSPEMTLKLFREAESSLGGNDITNHLERCYQETEDLMMEELEDFDDESAGFPRTDYYDAAGSFQ